MVDPDNKLDELHEEWDYKNDPGGNNVGRYPIAVLAEEPKAAAGLAVVSGRTASAAVTEGDFKMTSIFWRVHVPSRGKETPSLPLSWL